MSQQIHHTLFTVYWLIKFGTHVQNGDVIVEGWRVVQPVGVAPCHIVNSSARFMLCGARSYCEVLSILTVNKKILKFVLRVVLLYCIVVGSRRLMPPDALQSTAYCPNPGL